MKMKFYLGAPSIIGALAIIMSPVSVKATSYTLSDCNFSGYPGPYGTVTVSLTDSTHATVTFTSENGYFFLDGSSAAVNVNSSDFSAAIITDNGAFKQFNYGSQQVDGWGTFNLTVDQQSASPNSRATTISFSLTDIVGTWGSADDVLFANSGDHTVAAHIITPDGLYTGYASDGPNNHVPDGGSTVLLLGTVLWVLGLVRRKQR